MSRSRLFLLTLAAAASTAVVARGAPAPETVTSTATAPAAEACVVPVPRPLLDKDKYSDRGFEYGPENTATETASSGTVRIEIKYAGCHDGFEHSFAFVESKPLASFDDRDRWLAFAAAQLKGLQTYRRGRGDVNDLLDFLSGAKIATIRKKASELRIEVCRDGSPAKEDGCSLKSGGGWRFAVRALDKGRIRVDVSRYLTVRR